VSESATLAACLTPPGNAALATLAVRGPQAWSIARSLFQARAKASELPDEPLLGQFWLGRFGGDLADEVVLTVKRTGPEPWVEIHCHGGREVIRLLLETLESRGVRCCEWQELEKLTTEAPHRAAAMAALVQAKTARTAAILLDQMQGAFGRALKEILDFLRTGNLRDAAGRLAELSRHAALGRHLITPWRITIAGAPNVGKSSLINALAGYQRSIVAPTPGTTRDVVTTLVAFDGWPAELADTAGLRSEADALEAEGIGLALDAVRSADLCLWLLDASTEPVWPDARLGSVRLIINKVDLPAAWDIAETKGALAVSALTGTGIGELTEAIGKWLVPEPPPTGSAVPFTPELCDSIATAAAHCQAGQRDDALRALESILTY
jgi:tRNA modification GTPase